MSRSNLLQRLIGLMVLILCGLGIRSVWQTALSNGDYSRVAAGLLPVLAVFGLGLLLLPLDFTQLLREENVAMPGVGSNRRVPAFWIFLIFAAMAAGFANWYAIALRM
jgi:hypothetical protein